MKIKTTEYKITSTIRNTFQVYKQTSYFGISWDYEHIGEEYYDLPSAKTLIRMILDNKK